MGILRKPKLKASQIFSKSKFCPKNLLNLLLGIQTAPKPRLLLLPNTKKTKNKKNVLAALTSVLSFVHFARQFH